jgi:hypothetical protein
MTNIEFWYVRQKTDIFAWLHSINFIRVTSVGVEKVSAFFIATLCSTHFGERSVQHMSWQVSQGRHHLCFPCIFMCTIFLSRGVSGISLIQPSGDMISVRNQAPHHFPDLLCVESSTVGRSLSQQKKKNFECSGDHRNTSRSFYSLVYVAVLLVSESLGTRIQCWPLW